MLGKFRKKKSRNDESDGEVTIEDLITLERYEEAKEKLKYRLKLHPKDLHSHLKLAEVYVELKEAMKALDEYVFVADSQADDGFFDKAIAVLSKAAKIAPGDDTIPRRLEKYRNMKKMEDRRRLAIEGLLANSTTQVGQAANQALAMELLWNKIVKSHLVGALSAEHLKRLFSVITMRKTTAGEVLAQHGENKPLIYLIVDGEVQAVAEAGGQVHEIKKFTTGDLIGESTLLEKKTWPATYKVVAPGTVFTLDRGGFEKTLVGQEDPRGYISVLRQQANDRAVATLLMRLSV